MSAVTIDEGAIIAPILLSSLTFLRARRQWEFPLEFYLQRQKAPADAAGPLPDLPETAERARPERDHDGRHLRRRRGGRHGVSRAKYRHGRVT
jgi:hypothetical protein